MFSADFCKIVLYKTKSQHLPIFPGRCHPSIFGTTQFNFCVRNGNRWDLSVISTGFNNNVDLLNFISISIIFIFVNTFAGKVSLYFKLPFL